jgi:hypothetical protein
MRLDQSYARFQHWGSSGGTSEKQGEIYFLHEQAVVDAVKSIS